MDVQAPSMGAGRCLHACEVFDNKMYVIGGLSNASDGSVTELSTTEVYDPEANAWRAGPDTGICRGAHYPCVLDGRLHVLGGRGRVRAQYQPDMCF